MKESDLYPKLKTYLESQGFEVKSEVDKCDVVALRDELVIVIELKLSLNLTVVLQAVDRLQLSDVVYIGVPYDVSILKKKRKSIIKMIKMLGLGLLTIDHRASVGAVDILCDPAAYTPKIVKKRQQRLLREFQHRVGDPNQGGASTKKGVVTAYRQKAIAIAAYLAEHGESKPVDIAKQLSEPKSRAILYDNVYGWFDRPSRGCYCLSPRGLQEHLSWLGQDSS